MRDDMTEKSYLMRTGRVSLLSIAGVLAACMLALGAAACSDREDDAAVPSPGTPSATASPQASTTSQPSLTPTDAASTAPTASATITADAAARIVLDTYGGKIVSIELDTHHGEPTWEVEARGTTHGRIEVEVSRLTGKIVEVEQEDH